MILTFDAQKVREFLEVSRNSDNRRPTSSQMANPEMWRADLDADRRKALLTELADKGYPMGVKGKDVDPAKIPVGVWLVGDQGVYMMSNAPLDKPGVDAKMVKHIAYAEEVDPTTLKFDEWWDAKRASFGGDDGCDFISEEDIKPALDAAKDGKVRIDLTPDDMSLLVPHESPEP